MILGSYELRMILHAFQMPEIFALFCMSYISNWHIFVKGFWGSCPAITLRLLSGLVLLPLFFVFAYSKCELYNVHRRCVNQNSRSHQMSSCEAVICRRTLLSYPAPIYLFYFFFLSYVLLNFIIKSYQKLYILRIFK